MTKKKYLVLIISLAFMSLIRTVIPIAFSFLMLLFLCRIFYYLIKKNTVKARKSIIYTAISFILAIVSAFLFVPSENDEPPVEVATNSVSTEEVVFSSSESSTTELETATSSYEEVAINYEVAKESFFKELENKEYVDEIQTIDLNNGEPIFSEEDLSIAQGSWKEFGDLDALGRATSAEAMLNSDMIPTDKRETLTVNPKGWNNKKLKSGYLYNRTHLIGYQLSGENNNERNLITGTRQLNNPEMLRFEMDIATYLKENEQHYVRYSVIPIYKNNELVPRGVNLQAKSVNDDVINFNVYIFNVQNDVAINYSDGTSVISSAESVEEAVTNANGNDNHANSTDTHEEEKHRPNNLVGNNGQTATVFITSTGEKYHLHSGCRGLNNANSVTEISLSQAQSSGYTLCGWEG